MYRRVALSIAVLTGAVLASGGAGLAVSWDSAGLAGVAWYAAGLLLSLPSVGLGLLVAARRPDNPVGALLTFVGFAVAAIPSLETYIHAALRHPEAIPLPAAVIPLDQGVWMLMYLPVALLMLYFPDGRLPGPRWRWIPVALIATFVLFDLIAATSPGPFVAPGQDAPHALGTLPPALAAIGFVLLPIFLGLLIASAAAMVTRFRRAADDPVRRAQLKWFAVAALWLPLSLLLCWVGYLLMGVPDLALIGLFGVFLTVPAGTAIAMLRHDLYDVDRAISTAVTYGLVSAVLLSVYTFVSFLVGMLLGQGSTVAAAGAAALCAAALTPVRARAGRAVDRRMYPQRRAAIVAIEALRRGTDDGAAEPEELESVLRNALRDPLLRVGYRLPRTGELLDAAGEAMTVASGQATPVLLRGQEVGVLVRGTVGSAQLLREIAAMAAPLVELIRLRIELTGALREAESSRARLLSAQYRERHRLERDLHDGAQQRLVVLGMGLRLAQRHLHDGSVDVNELLDQTVAELGTAVAELRSIAHGLRPSSLDDGLDSAIRSLAGSLSVPIIVETQSGAVPDHIAATAYYVVSEAITNAVKHAEAQQITLRVNREESMLAVRIHDDGRGGARVHPGSGLAGLADRVAAAGGALFVDSPPDRGTTVKALLPCG